MKNTEVISVAVADDHTILRKGVIELINSFGEFQVAFDAVSGKDLVAKMERALTPPDVCLIDINMPELNGFETAAVIRDRWPDVKILALSMYDNEYSIIKMLRNGAHGYILKETDPRELREALLGVFHKSYYHSEMVSGRLIHTLQYDKKTEMNITEKELMFLSFCCTELSYKEIAGKMNLSPRTVEGYRDSLFEKLSIKTRTGLVVFALRMGLCA